MRFYYLDTINSSIVYQEGIKLFTINNLNTHIYTHDIISCFFFSNSQLVKNKFFFQFQSTNLNFVCRQICLMLFGLKKRFRLTGRGYYMYNKGNILYFKLGFSHVVRAVLSMDAYVNNKIKKRKFWYVSGFSHFFINSITNNIRSLRGPHLYSKRVKGIYVQNEFIPRGVFSFNKF